MNGTKAASIVVATLKAMIFPIVYISCQLLVMLMLAMFQAAASPAASYDYDAVFDLLLGNTLVVMLYGCVLTLVAVAVTLRVQGKPAGAALKLNAAPATAVLLSLVLGAVLNFTLGFCLSALPIPADMMDDYNGMMELMLADGSPLLIILTLALLVPITEEVVFRGMAMNTLRPVMPALAAVIVQAAIFAVIHGNPLQMAYVLPVALIFGFIYKWSDSLLTTVAAHIGFNAPAAIISTLPEAQSATDISSTTQLVICAAVGLAMTCLLIYAVRRTLQKQRG